MPPCIPYTMNLTLSHLIISLLYLFSLVSPYPHPSPSAACGDIIHQSCLTNCSIANPYYCFKDKPISYDTCKLFLRQSQHCDAVIYTNARCSLFSRYTNRDLQTPSAVSIQASFTDDSSIHLIRLTEGVDNCTAYSGPSNYPVGKSIMTQCLSHHNLLSSASTHRQMSEQRWSQLPRLGIIVSVTKAWMRDNMKEVEAAVNNFECYATTHSYAFHLHVMPSMETSRFFHVRHQSVVQTYLHRYQYLLVMDADNLVVNMSQSLDHLFVSNMSSPTDVFLHMREGGEVTASTYIIRNSLYSRCFMRYWRMMAPLSRRVWVPTPNHDNGDLVVALMNLISEEALLNCAEYIKPTSSLAAYDTGILLCFRLFRGALADPSTLLPHIRVFFIRESFFRMHLGNSGTQGEGRQVLLKDSTCHKHDIIAHGWKAIASSYWPTDSVCDVDAFRRGKGGNQRCTWLTVEEEMHIVQTKCYWRSPLCKDAETQVNVCLNSEGCRLEKINMQRWALCVDHGVCNPYITIPAFYKKYATLELPRPWLSEYIKS